MSNNQQMTKNRSMGLVHGGYYLEYLGSFARFHTCIEVLEWWMMVLIGALTLIGTYVEVPSEYTIILLLELGSFPSFLELVEI
jgi:hypothetical protein